jgi:isoleucyl-tRNA synthetase
VKQVQYSEKVAVPQGFATATEADTQVSIDTARDDKLLGEGIMRDLARRVQALRKELGYSPTDILDAVYISDLDGESISLLDFFLNKMAELVRSRKVCLCTDKREVKAKWHECQFEDKCIGIAVIKEQ